MCDYHLQLPESASEKYINACDQTYKIIRLKDL